MGSGMCYTDDVSSSRGWMMKVCRRGVWVVIVFAALAVIGLGLLPGRAYAAVLSSKETSCTDGVDNDGNGRTDCADSDCDGNFGCEFGTELTCNDCIDNDADGNTDCADTSCAVDRICEATEVACSDLFDNDGDGAMDCADTDCNGVEECGTTADTGQIWPTPNWQVASSPQEIGLSAGALDDYSTWLQQKVSSKPYGTVVVRFGKIGFEEYGGGATVSSKWEVGSIRKSIASSLLGIAIGEGKLSLSTRVYNVWPEIFTLTGMEKDKNIIMRHLANATSGWKSSAQPGARWQYKNIAFTAGHAVIGRVYDLPEDKVAPMVETRIKNKIGASSWRVYHFNGDWNTSTGSGPKLAVDSNMRDLSKYGYLWLREGKWNGEQIVPLSYIRQARQNQVESYGRHYGYWWFTNDGRVLLPNAPEDSYYHIGNGSGGRRTVLFVSPSLDLVAVISTHYSAYDIGRDYLSQPVSTVNEWIGKIIASVLDE